MSRRILLDTGPAYDFIFRRRDTYNRIVERKKNGIAIGICPPVAGEIWAGVESSKTRDSNISIVHRNIASFRMWPFTAEAAREFGRIYAYLKSVGRPMQKIDIQIAAIALTLGNCTVVTVDSDLSAIPGLSVENWAKLPS